MDISVVIPAFNEAESLPELSAWIERVMQQYAYSYEVIFIDDGSSDNTWEVVRQLSEQNPNLKGIRFQRNYGKSAALNEGFKAAQGDVVITMDADLQDSPEEIPELRSMILDQKYDLVSGWKKKRYDPLSKTIPTKLFNWATRRASGIRLHDFNCGLKAYRHPVVKSIEVYGEMHRYIPVLAKWAGFRKIGEKAVQHRERKYGTTKFGLERFTNGLLDLLTITFATRFGKRPMHFFGTLGLLSFMLGIMATLYLVIYKLINFNNPHARALVEKPSFFLAMLAIIVGVQLFVAGFLGELISRSSSDRNAYLINEKLGL